MYLSSVWDIKVSCSNFLGSNISMLRSIIVYVILEFQIVLVVAFPFPLRGGSPEKIPTFSLIIKSWVPGIQQAKLLIRDNCENFNLPFISCQPLRRIIYLNPFIRSDAFFIISPSLGLLSGEFLPKYLSWTKEFLGNFRKDGREVSQDSKICCR